jgi:hypothetical protein
MFFCFDFQGAMRSGTMQTYVDPSAMELSFRSKVPFYMTLSVVIVILNSAVFNSVHASNILSRSITVPTHVYDALVKFYYVDTRYNQGCLHTLCFFMNETCKRFPFLY